MDVIYVDDEADQLKHFKHTVREFPEIKKLSLFSRPLEAVLYARENQVDIAFLDIMMPDMNGLDLAAALHTIDESIRIIFVSSSAAYAMDAFRLDAVGYVLKPYTTAAIRKEFDKALRLLPKTDINVSIDTIPDFVVKVRGNIVVFNRPKVEELFALLVDRGDSGLTSGEAIATLWPDRAKSESTSALYRTTAKRLIDALRGMGISDIICTDGRRRYVDTKMVDCDLYRILAGNMEPLRKYSGEYMRRFSWAEERNGWLWHLQHRHEN